MLLSGFFCETTMHENFIYKNKWKTNEFPFNYIYLQSMFKLKEEKLGVAELRYESGCRDVALLRLIKDFGIM
jgi:hypothetical protein